MFSYSFLKSKVMALMLRKFPVNYDWNNGSDRYKFESELKVVREKRANWSFWEKMKWFVPLVLSQFLIVLALYGGCAYVIVGFV